MIGKGWGKRNQANGVLCSHQLPLQYTRMKAGITMVHPDPDSSAKTGQGPEPKPRHEMGLE